MVDHEGVTFAYFDGDDIGSRLELLLLDNRPRDAQKYSEAVCLGLTNASRHLTDVANAEIVFAGGDDLLAMWDKGLVVNLAHIYAACEMFRSACDRTMSVGIASSTRVAAENLRRAKLLGKSQIVHATGNTHASEN